MADAVRVGNLDDSVVTGLDQYELRRKLEQFVLYRRLIAEPLRPHELDLMIAIIVKSRRVFEEKFPGSEFHVLFHNDGQYGATKELVKRLKKLGVPTHTYSDVSPKDKLRGLKYDVHETDPHPSPLAHRVIADYIVENIARPLGLGQSE